MTAAMCERRLFAGTAASISTDADVRYPGICVCSGTFRPLRLTTVGATGCRCSLQMTYLPVRPSLSALTVRAPGKSINELFGLAGGDDSRR